MNTHNDEYRYEFNKSLRNIFTDLNPETIYDVVNLASIVEKEEKNSEAKSTVAGILKKRLKRVKTA